MFTFPQFLTLRSWKLHSFALSFLYEFSVLCGRCCISQSAKSPLLVTVHGCFFRAVPCTLCVWINLFVLFLLVCLLLPASALMKNSRGLRGKSYFSSWTVTTGWLGLWERQCGFRSTRKASHKVKKGLRSSGELSWQRSGKVSWWRAWEEQKQGGERGWTPSVIRGGVWEEGGD